MFSPSGLERNPLRPYADGRWTCFWTTMQERKVRTSASLSQFRYASLSKYNSILDGHQRRITCTSYWLYTYCLSAEPSILAKTSDSVHRISAQRSSGLVGLVGSSCCWMKTQLDIDKQCLPSSIGKIFCKRADSLAWYSVLSILESFVVENGSAIRA